MSELRLCCWRGLGFVAVGSKKVLVPEDASGRFPISLVLP